MKPLVHVHRALLLSILLVTTGASSALADVPKFLRDGEWIEVKTHHFSVITNAGSSVGRDVARKLERFSQALAHADTALRTHAAPTQVFVFRKPEEMDHFRPRASESRIAFFVRAEDRNLMAVNGSATDVDRSEAALHQLVHGSMAMNFPGVPMWLNEGLAEYYSTGLLSQESAEFGKPKMEVVRAMEGQKPLTIETLFAMNARSPEYRDNDSRILFYAQSFMLTHWLQSKAGGGTERFNRFVSRVRDGAEPLAAFREAYPSSEWDPMVRNLPGYVNRIEFEPPRRVALSAPLEADTGAERALSLAEVLTRLGELQLVNEERIENAEDKFEESEELFEEALELDKRFAEAEASLGLIEDLLDKGAKAESHYERALALDSKNVRVWNLAGRGAMRRLTKLLMAGASSESLVSVGGLARERYRRSLELDPNNLEALAGPGQSFAILGEPPDDAAVRGLERAVDALRGRNDLAAWLSVLRALQGRSAEAEELMRRRVAPGTDRTEFANAQMALEAAQFNRAVALANKGRLAESEALFADIAERSSDPEVRSRATEAIAKIRNAKGTDDMVALYDEARALANAGKLEDARERLTDIRNRTNDPAMKSAAERDLQRLDAETRLSRAFELVDGSKLREAEELLTAADAVWPDDSHRTRRDKALADVRGRLGIERARGLVKAGKLAEARDAYARVIALDVSDEMKRHARDRVKQLEAAINGQ